MDYLKKSNNDNKFNNTTLKEFVRADDKTQNELANYIKNNLSTMDSYEIQRIHSKITTQLEMYNTLLHYELIYYNPETKISDLSDMTQLMDLTLKKFRPNIMNTCIEDSEWTIHTLDTSIKYEMLPDEVIFDNSIKTVYRYNNDTFQYLHDLKFYLLKHIDQTKLGLEMKIVESQEQISWIIYRLYKKYQKKY